MNPQKISAASRKRILEQRKKSREATSQEKAKFENCLEKVHDTKSKGSLDKLIKTIQREGERLNHFKSLNQLEHYKKKVREFIKIANRGTFKVKATGFVDSEGDYSSQLIVEKVDTALEELTTYVLGKESQPLQILQQLDLIKGLLTDLYQ